MNAEAGVRLRQAVLVAGDLAPVSDRLRSELALGEPFADPGVGAFGLHNAVYAIGDTFLEVVSPAQPDTTAGRYLDRRGDGGYMVIFQLADLDAARDRAAKLGVRVVWQLDLPDISGTHLHPADTRGAIVSLDRADPPGSWRWGGPEWTEAEGTGAPGQLRGVTIAVNEPAATAARWGELLGVAPEGDRLELDGSHVRFEHAEDERLTEIHVDVPDRDETVAIGGASFRLSPFVNGV
jgi:Glyoxalase-like domain